MQEVEGFRCSRLPADGCVAPFSLLGSSMREAIQRVEAHYSFRPSFQGISFPVVGRNSACEILIKLARKQWQRFGRDSKEGKATSKGQKGSPFHMHFFT